MTDERTRREEILATAAHFFASAGSQASLREIADACGILPGSLYHHFESKDSLIAELVTRYREDLDRVAEKAMLELGTPAEKPIVDRIIELGESIAECAVQHRAALILTLYEPPTTAHSQLTELVAHTPDAIDHAMLEYLQAAHADGALRDGLDLELLARRICQSMLNLAVGVFHKTEAARQLPAQKCRILLHGVAVETPTNQSLDRSAPMRAALDVASHWDDVDEADPADHIRAAARTEFGRRGFESTTIRDIAKAAQVSSGSVYRRFGSKDDLLRSIMTGFGETCATAWAAVLETEASIVEKLDALAWLNIKLIDRFDHEFKIQLAWMRQSPPTSVDLDLPFGQQVVRLGSLLEATRDDELKLHARTPLDNARVLFELLLAPENVLARGGADAVHALFRDTVLRGATAS